MRALLTKMKPEVFSDLIALVALYRPGPLDSGMVDTFVETKHGRKKASYLLPELEPILKETYGVIVYQEQVMKISNVLANYSLGDADILRRAMGKKIPEVMEAEREKFMNGARVNNLDMEKAGQIFDLMAKFAGYGFNKSHSAAYALIAYQTARLKPHYPAQFMAALLSCDVSNTDKVVLYINECKEHEIDVLPPDINESDQDFTVVNDRIRFGLAAVKNVGGAALDSIMEERAKDGPFKSLGDLCARVDSRKVNKRVIESLVKAGAFDSLGARRSQLFAILDQAMEHAQAAQRDKESGQLSLFSLMPAAVKEKSTVIPLPDIAEWPEQEKLAAEKETVGFYITGHPLDDFRRELNSITATKISDLAELNDNVAVRVGGLFSSYKEHKSKKGERMAFAVLEDTVGRVEVLVFPATFARAFHLLEGGQPVIVQGKLQKEEEQGAKIIADEILSLDEARLQYTSATQIMVKADLVNTSKLEELKKVLRQNHGPCPVLLTLHFAGRGEADIESTELTVNPSLEFSAMVARVLGYQAASFRMTQPELTNRNNKRVKGEG